MACGTGKTLVALWVAEKVTQAFSLCAARPESQAGKPAPLILILVPSLALLRQTLHEWTRETSWPALPPLCVCSDPSVKAGSDEIVLRPSDLDFPVTTDSAQVRAFLAAPFAGVKLVFSTCQSAHVVAAGMKRGDTFDPALFDEAHTTAGREGVHFGFALTDQNLPIRQRLFLTATPRHYDVRHRDREGDARLVYSMDAPEICGPVAHQLPFAEAARRGIIWRHEVVVSVVTSEMVNAHLLRHLPRRWQTQTFGDFSRDERSPERVHLSAVAGEFRFRQKVDHVATHGGLPVQAIRLVEDDLVLLWRTVQLCARADQRVDHFQVRILTSFVMMTAGCGNSSRNGKSRMSHCLTGRSFARNAAPARSTPRCPPRHGSQRSSLADARKRSPSASQWVRPPA